MRLGIVPLAAGCVVAACFCGAPAARAQLPPAPGWAQPPPPLQSAPAPGYVSRSTPASSVEVGTLYGVSALYGIGLGVWLDAELGLDDPSAILIPPTLLGVAAPITAYALNHPRMPRGLPAAISSGLFIGAGQGLGVAGVQHATSSDGGEWGIRGVARAVGIGATVGGIGGYAVGVAQEPSPNISLFASSGVVWGTLVGAAIGLGSSEAGVGFSRSNDSMAWGGLIGFNVGLVTTMGLSTWFVPSLDQISWMWLGGSIGALVSLPVYLFYLGDGGPPAKRGLLFSATATTLGIVTGGIFGPAFDDVGWFSGTRLGSVEYLSPWVLRGGLGVQLGGTLY